MTVVIVVAAIGALVLLVSILALSRSRAVDESERFRYVSDLTSKWSRQQQLQSQAVPAVPAVPAAPAVASAPAVPTPGEEAAGSNVDGIDIREAEPGVRRRA